ncbi:xanthine dehydrogenase family protein molybdopterin-binding subunit [Oceanicella actignis]|uniref:xanthine dehydrogenase family protein molybdopterin-binding subunit n=1 Tax=Oceanicella actignis TaxID=1189325 RepID=UPI0011E774A7|nr:xanthine dehydrogenase family protein molybdopterin-binding subunit [Oceanicella actignis]TYO88808.1 carbon-monoxide dehydrogenase large subunit [Oceanicella actignis]
MTKFGVSQPVRRVEDQRFLTGHGRYVDDIAPASAAHAAFVRSPHAHARILSVDVSEAQAAPGVRLVLTGADMDAHMDHDIDSAVVVNRDGTPGAKPRRTVLAVDRVRFVGDAVAMVVADTPAQARAAAELIAVEYEELPAAFDTARAMEQPEVHPDVAPRNLAFDWAFGDEQAAEDAFARAAHVVELPLVNNRVIACPIEPRGAFAEWDPEAERLHLCFNGQGVWGLKEQLARRLRLDPGQVRVTNPDVGGGFGMKAFPHPEHFALAVAARLLGGAVRWMADRSEAMMADVQGRDHVTHARAAFDENLRLTALRVDCVANMGAYNSGFAQNIPSTLAKYVLPGVYDFQTAFFSVKGVYTNTTPVDAYRGAGRPEAIYVIERLMEWSARRLGVDPAELRRRNFIPREAFPYRTLAGELYDVGDFERVLDRAMRESDWNGFEARRAEAAARGMLRGRGMCYYIESILGAPNETARIEFAEDGGVNLYVGTQSNGQGHETVYAQILSQRAGLPFDRIRVIQGDSDLIAKGGGTGGSRSVTTQGTAINAAADEMIEKFRPLAEEELEAAAADIVFEEGAFRVAGTDRAVEMIELARIAREKGRADLLTTEREATLPGRSFPNGCHVCEVEVDPDTGAARVVRYVVVDDLGVLMNPLLAEGQVHGGVVQGLGQALSERVVHDENGQLLTASFMDYALPRAEDVPMIEFHSEPTPSTANPLGMKGCGEAGTVGALAAAANAVLDALAPAGVTHVDMPMTPHRIWTWLQEARARRA